MSFSARQQQCLEAMGIVPWVSKSESAPVAAQHQNTEAENPAVIVNAAVTSIVSERVDFVPSSMPDNIEELKLWLPSQPVGSLTVRSAQQRFIGQIESPILVVVDSKASATAAQPAAGSPFNAESAQLFDLMMRSIGVTLGQRKLCRLSSSNDASDVNESACVSQLCVPQTKAILLLVQDWNSLTAPVTDHFRVDQPALPVWRIPHPDLLIELNQLKRQAWTSLQSLQSVLT